MPRVATLIAALLLCPVLAAQGEMGSSRAFKVRQEASSMQDRIGTRVDRTLKFTDELGRPRTLGQYFPGSRPVILDLGYYGCPGLCGQVMNGMVEALEGIDDLEPSRDYEILSISIDPREQPDLAKAKKDTYLARFARAGASDGWHFCVGEQAAIKSLTDAVGFSYFWAEHENRFDHPPALIFLSKEGEVMRVLQGTTYTPRDVRYALIETSKGEKGTLVDQVFLSCLTFNPVTRTYSVTAMTVVKVFGAITVFALAVMITVMLRREKKRVAAASA